jgi:adenosylmethionine-8-amino-7-oxononanoate aminotransferase
VKDRNTRESYAFDLRIGNRVIMEARELGVMLRPLGDVIVLMPPLAVSLDELDILFEVTEKAILKVTEG